jgi:hypothetical protein
MKRTFVLGMGAQKTGSSWLHRYIKSYFKANLGFAKEYHIWDILYTGFNEKERVNRESITSYDSIECMRYGMQHIDGFYEAYFSSILNKGFEITGDITPSYSTLSAADLRTVRERLLRITPDLKVIFVMRDPFERCWSAARMFERDDPEVTDSTQFLQESYHTPPFEARTRYEIICENIRSVFAPEEIYFGIYETMFEKAELTRLSQFLDIPVNTSLIKKRVNTTKKTRELPVDLKNRILDFYSSTYAYCNAHFPQTKHLWNQPKGD